MGLARLRDQLPGLAAAWIPDSPHDLIGPGIAIDETAQLKKGEATACVAPAARRLHRQGRELCDHGVLRLRHRARAGLGGLRRVHAAALGIRAARRRAAGIPDELPFATKPQLAINQLDRQVAAGSPARWVAFDEVYGRSEPLRTRPPSTAWPMWGSSRATTRSGCPRARRSGPIRPSRTRCSSAGRPGTAPKDPATATGP